MEDKKYILIAEDRKFYANTFKMKLTQEGYEVNIANNGEEALKAISERRPDLLLMDLMMPGMSGFEPLEQLPPGIKVIVMSNLSQEGDQEKVKEMGACEYIVKSNVSLQEGVDIVKKYL